VLVDGLGILLLVGVDPGNCDTAHDKKKHDQAGHPEIHLGCPFLHVHHRPAFILVESHGSANKDTGWREKCPGRELFVDAGVQQGSASVSDLPPSPIPGKGSVPLFRRRATALFRAGIALVFLSLASVAYGVFEYYHSPWWTRVGFSPDQPVPFSHRHHAGELRIDCRYCHSSVESSPFAGMPSTQTCLSCHSQIFADTALLRPVVASLEHGVPLRWHRVADLPAYVYFDHSIHVAKGVSCTTCHGNVGDMALTAKANRFDMRWCLDCHRSPPRAVHPAHLTNCSTCHR